MTTRTNPLCIAAMLGAITTGLLCAGCGTVEGFPFLSSSVASFISPGSDGCYIPDNEDELVDEVVRLVNEERAAHGLDPVTVDATLTMMAGDYACTLIRDDYFGHYHPETGDGPGERATAFGYRYRAVGENLAAGQRAAAEAMKDWMNSTEGHRENILNPMWEHVGIAIRTGGTYGVYWVQEFGAPW